MASQLTRPTVSTVPSRRLRRLLGCGIAAGPVFCGSWAVRAVTRTGFDPAYHPLSLLSLGRYGWIQIATFTLTGGLVVACSAGLRRVLRPGPGGTWAPTLLGLYGIGLMMAGIFVTDAGAGFPPGAPSGPPPTMSWHALLHEISFFVALLSWTAACAVLARRFAALHQKAWLVATLVTALAGLGLPLWPGATPTSFVPRTMVATALQFAYLAGLAVYLRRVVRIKSELPDS